MHASLSTQIQVVCLHSAFTWKLEKCNGRHISCCWLHIRSGGGGGRHGGQFSGTCTGLPLPIFSLRPICLSIFISFLPSMLSLVFFLSSASYFLKRKRNRLRLKRNIRRIIKLVFIEKRERPYKRNVDNCVWKNIPCTKFPIHTRNSLSVFGRGLNRKKN